MIDKNLIQRHMVLTYFVLAFVIAWVGSFLVIGPKFLSGAEILFEDMLLIGISMFLAPSLVGMTCAYLADGKGGLQTMFASMSAWRVGKQWYAAALVFPILILIVLLGLSSLISREFLPYFFPMGIVVGLIAGFLEEVGWTGFAFPKMVRKMSPLAAALVIGVLHVLWHLAADYLGASGLRGAYWLPRFVGFCAAMVPMRVILVWVYVNTESLFMAQIMHVSSTGFLSILVPLTLSPANDTLFYLVYAGALWMVVFMIIAKYGTDLKTLTPKSRIQPGI